MSDNSNSQVLPTKIFDILQSFQRTAALKAAIELDRKVLADLATNDPAGFAALAETAKRANSAAA